MGTLQEQSGKVTRSVGTKFSVNERTVVEVHYDFEWKGATHSGYSYTNRRVPSNGSKVTIEFKESQPEISRIRGMRFKPASPWILFVLLFPIVGLGFMLAGFKKAKKVLPLLAKGVHTHGVLRNKEPTNTRINEQTVMKYTFEFFDAKGEVHEVVEKTHLYHTLEDDDEEPLPYMESNPKHASLLDALPASPKIDQNDRILPAPWIKAVMALILPMIIIIGHGLWH